MVDFENRFSRPFPRFVPILKTGRAKLFSERTGININPVLSQFVAITWPKLKFRTFFNDLYGKGFLFFSIAVNIKFFSNGEKKINHQNLMRKNRKKIFKLNFPFLRENFLHKNFYLTHFENNCPEKKNLTRSKTIRLRHTNHRHMAKTRLNTINTSCKNIVEYWLLASNLFLFFFFLIIRPHKLSMVAIT